MVDLWFEETKKKIREDPNQDRPRCPRCSGGLLLWGDVTEGVHAECSECDWFWND